MKILQLLGGLLDNINDNKAKTYSNSVVFNDENLLPVARRANIITSEF